MTLRHLGYLRWASDDLPAARRLFDKYLGTNPAEGDAEPVRWAIGQLSPTPGSVDR